MKNTGPILVLFIVMTGAVCLPAMAQAAPAQHKSDAVGFLGTLLNNPLPWIIGVVLDVLIAKGKDAISKNMITKCTMSSIMSMVLGYPSIWGTFAVFASAAIFRVDETTSWVLCSLTLVVTLGLVKMISYWVIYEKFPNKVKSALYFVSALLVVLSALGIGFGFGTKE
ncbi:MAG: hypothetical protein K2X29_13515 [Candidatus Obscuribacterales bacterium]|nr:hypothetical protein [Candidatus Obscuribacterales bacterium]